MATDTTIDRREIDPEKVERKLRRKIERAIEAEAGVRDLLSNKITLVVSAVAALLVGMSIDSASMRSGHVEYPMATATIASVIGLFAAAIRGVLGMRKRQNARNVQKQPHRFKAILERLERKAQDDGEDDKADPAIYQAMWKEYFGDLDGHGYKKPRGSA